MLKLASVEHGDELEIAIRLLNPLFGRLAVLRDADEKIGRLARVMKLLNEYTDNIKTEFGGGPA